MSEKKLREAVVVACGRTPYCKANKGSFANVHPVEYGAQALLGVLNKVPQLKHEDIGDVIVGCSMPFGVQGANMARLIVQRAGLPDSVTAQTVNRFCSSGLQTIATAANAIRCGEEDVMVAGGVESMSMVPMLVGIEDADPWLMEHRPEVYVTMGITAENVARRWNVSRADMDAMAAESHRRAALAQNEGFFDDQIIPITVPGPDGQDVVVTKDEGIRPGCNVESLSQLKPCFLEDGLVTAATSSQRTDGAGFVVLMSEEKAQELGLKPLARFVAFSTGGVPAEVMGVGPIEAVPKVLKKTGMTIDQMDVIELNEAFASQALVVIRTIGMDPAKVNPWGGAMALGHPLGATGAMLTCKALSYLKRNGGKYGMVTMCIGGGMGAAGIYEML
ncbi:thiolase family protein [Intestinimonas massiliensis (ex Afouda et al. 2020)]|uniref:thiolase family protein n=1 Tax=Intestinimonas massiliensis (ex Afouda et al. 2020) TaxID=1673721 RepID=UPI001A939E46|nr:thiolase family protein [Intestinimonas massiliensis (ex Afouda et al. 2020)]